MADKTGGFGMNPLSIAQAGLGAIQTGIGIVEKISSKKKIKDLLNQRQAYQTPQEIYDIINATLNQSQGDTITRDFQTNQVGQQTSNVIGAATRGGADPNTLSNLLQSSINSMLQVGENFHQSNIKGFSSVLNSMKMGADYEDAVYASKENITRDKLAAAGADLSASTGNISGGINTITGALASEQTMNLYKDKNKVEKNSFQDWVNNFLGTQNQLKGSITNEDMFISKGTQPTNTLFG